MKKKKYIKPVVEVITIHESLCQMNPVSPREGDYRGDGGDKPTPGQGPDNGDVGARYNPWSAWDE